MKQLTLATVGFERYAKTTRRAAFLAEMEHCAVVGVVRADRTFLSQTGQWSSADWCRADVAHLFFLQQWFQPVGPVGRRDALRMEPIRCSASMRWAERSI